MEYSWEQLNYYRLCHISLHIVPLALRQIFKREWDFLYKSSLGEWQDTPQNGREFCHQEAELNFDRPNWHLSSIENGNTAEWDCSVLFDAILHSASIGSSLRPVVRLNVNRVREIRDELAHITKTSFTNEELRSYVADLEDTFSSLDLSTNELKALMYQTCCPVMAASGNKAVFGNQRGQIHNVIQQKEKAFGKGKPFCLLARSPPHEVIRRSEIGRITSKMREMADASNGAVSTIYLSGNPGCGKSQLARHIGNDFYSGQLDAVKESFVATLNAQTLETLTDSYIVLAYKLGITAYAFSDLSRREIQIDTIKSLLPFIVPRVREFSSWLLIVDNADNLALVNDFLPTNATKEWGHGQVLITTRDASAVPLTAPYTYHESLSGGMQQDDAMELLKLVSQLPDQAQAEEVAEYLEYLPLALAAAAYYVQSCVTSTHPINNWAEYLERVRSLGLREVTEEPLAKVNVAYPITMTAAVKMALVRAAESNEVIRQVFRFLSLCAREIIPLTSVINFVKACTVDKTEESIMMHILNCSLVYVRDVDESPGYLHVYKVVHDVMRKTSFCGVELKEQFQWIAAAVKVFDSHLKEELEFSSSQFRLLANVKNLISHCLVLLEHVTSLAPLETIFENTSPFITRHEVFSWLCTTAIACCKTDNPQHAKHFSMLAVTLLSNHSEAEDELLRAHVFSVHGSVLQQLCDLKEATAYYEKALLVQKTFGEQDRDVAMIYRNLATVNSSLGRYVEAIEFHEKALSIWKKIHGEDHEQVATSYHDLAIVYSNLGSYVQSKEFHQKALVVRRKLYGEMNENIATSYHSLGITCSNIGQFDDAKEFHERALELRRKIFGEEHRDVAASFHSLGVVCSNLGQYNQARELHEKALAIRERVFGEHPDVATSCHSLTIVCCNSGRYDQAKEWSEKALDIRARIFGEKHVDVAASYCNMGSVSNNAGEYNKAIEYFERALVIRTEILGSVHPDVAECFHNLGILSNNLGWYTRAIEYHRKALSIRRETFGEEHRDTAVSLNSLGDVCCNVGDYAQAEEYYERALIVRRKLFGEKHGDVASSFLNLGLVHSNRGEFGEAKECYFNALRIKKEIFGEEHVDVARSYSNLGVVYESMGELSRAKECFEKALVIAKKVLGGEHASVARLYSKLEAVDARIVGSRESSLKARLEAGSFPRK